MKDEWRERQTIKKKEQNGAEEEKGTKGARSRLCLFFIPACVSDLAWAAARLHLDPQETRH